jgi:hypothetical protein
VNRALSIVFTLLCLLAAAIALLAPSLAGAKDPVRVVLQTFPTGRVDLTPELLASTEALYRREFDAGLRAHLRSKGMAETSLPALQTASRLVQRNGLTLGLVRVTFPGVGQMMSVTGYEAGKLFVVKCDQSGTAPVSVEHGACAQKIAETFGVVLQDSERP